MAQDPIEVYTADGQRRQVSRTYWAQATLPELLRKVWHDPNMLYMAIDMAVADGMADQVAKAAQHLLRIDPDRERAVCALAIVQINRRRLRDAERTLRAYIKKNGETARALSTLGYVHVAREQTEDAIALLRRSLQLDPNEEQALGVWSALRVGRDASITAQECYRDIAEVPGSWLPQLWLARHALDAGDLGEALRLYHHILSLAPDLPVVMFNISGDLGRTGHIAEMLELLLPRFDLKVHDLRAGFNIAYGLLAAGRLQEARELIAQLRAECPPPFLETLNDLARRLDEADR